MVSGEENKTPHIILAHRTHGKHRKIRGTLSRREARGNNQYKKINSA